MNWCFPRNTGGNWKLHLSMQEKNACRIYHEVLLVGVFLILLALIYVRLRPLDTMRGRYSDEPGYLTVQQGEQEIIAESAANAQRVAEGFEQVYLPAGRYHLSIEATASAKGCYYEISDRSTNRVYATGDYTQGEKYHNLDFSADEPIVDMVVRSYAKDGKLEIYGYSMDSDGAVCTDAKWSILFLTAFIGVLIYNWRRWKAGRGNGLWLTILAGGMSVPHMVRFLPETHDIQFHLTRLYGLFLALRQGHFPERIDSAFPGGGNITPIMYPWVLLLPGALLLLGGTTLLFAWNATLIFLTFLTVFLSYLGAKELVNSRGAMIFTFLYTLNPYRLTDIYTRGAIGEAFAIAFLPFVVCSLEKLLREKSLRAQLFLIMGIAGLIWSHVLSVVMCDLLCSIRVVCYLLWNARDWKKYPGLLGRLFMSIAAAVLLNVWWVVPFLSYAGENFCIRQEGGLSDTGTAMVQLFINPTGFAMPLSGNSMEGEMSQSIGVVLLLGAILFLFLAGRSKLSDRDHRIGRAWLIMGGGALLLSSNLFPWDDLLLQSTVLSKTLGNLQFSWRFLSFAAFYWSFVTAIVVDCCWREYSAAAVSLLAVCGMTAGMSITAYAGNPVYSQDKWSYVWKIIYWDYNLSLVNDHKGEIGEWCITGSGPRAEGQTRITRYERDGINYKCSIENTGDRSDCVVIPVFYNGLYHALLTCDEATQELPSKMDTATQFTVVEIPANAAGELRLKYEEPAIWKLANIVSLFTIIGTVTGAHFVLSDTRSESRVHMSLKDEVTDQQVEQRL